MQTSTPIMQWLEAVRRGIERTFPVLLVCLSASLPFELRATLAPTVFPTPELAVEALRKAVNQTNRAAFTDLFGPEAQDLANPDTVQGARELREFAEAFNTSNRLVTVSAERRMIEVGAGGWTFPVPLVRTVAGWHYDATAGREEMLNRRIGRNELDVLRVMRAYVAAQREYASRDRDEDAVLEFAQRLGSTPGKTDGLYWPPDLNGEISPLGPLVAFAQAEGYSRSSRNSGKPQPFHGYFFRILTRQGKQAPGNKYDYIINGNMIGGFALIAWPAEYGQSGVMTFIVNQQGRVYERDLGPKTERTASKTDTYDPDTNWQLSAD